jgi:hypothetical protein
MQKVAECNLKNIDIAKGHGHARVARALFSFCVALAVDFLCLTASRCRFFVERGSENRSFYTF